MVSVKTLVKHGNMQSNSNQVSNK